MEFMLIQNNERYYKVPATGLPWKHLGLTPFVYNDKTIHLEDSKSKNIQEFYLKEKDFIIYSNSVIKTEHSHRQTKLIAASFGLEMILIQIKSEGFSNQILNLCKQVVLQIKDLSFDKAFKDYIKMTECSPQVKYYLLRAVVSKSLAYKMGWSSRKIIDDVLLAALLCDLGSEMATNPGIFHGEYLSSVMSLNHKISDAVTQGIRHHHEYNDGTGPLKLSRFQINPVAKIIRTVEDCLEMLRNNQDIHFFFSVASKNRLEPDIVDHCLEIFKKN